MDISPGLSQAITVAIGFPWFPLISEAYTRGCLAMPVTAVEPNILLHLGGRASSNNTKCHELTMTGDG